MSSPTGSGSLAPSPRIPTRTAGVTCRCSPGRWAPRGPPGSRPVPRPGAVSAWSPSSWTGTPIPSSRRGWPPSCAARGTARRGDRPAGTQRASPVFWSGRGGDWRRPRLRWLRRLISLPVGGVLDADGITLLSRIREEHGVDLHGRWILTPHPGEFSRLMSVPRDRVLDDPLGQALAAASQIGAVIVLKGHCRSWPRRMGGTGSWMARTPLSPPAEPVTCWRASWPRVSREACRPSTRRASACRCTQTCAAGLATQRLVPLGRPRSPPLAAPWARRRDPR